MKVLVTGNGGREHALAWRLAQSELVSRVYVAPGNAGTELEPQLENAAIDVMDFDGQIDFCRAHDVELILIGPEAPLVEGAVDRFTAAGLRCFGPNQRAAQLEGSKSFTKDFLKRHGIPTARYESFTSRDEALAYADSMELPVVIKADGLAAGKGVVIARSREEVEKAISDMLNRNAFGRAGARIVIEEFLQGEEASFIVVADGKDFVAFASSQDHKAAFDQDQGPNTGGMGAYSPAPVVTPEVHAKIVSQVIEPTIRGMAEDGNAYTGFLYAGLMINEVGEPSVIEFNCRFGDPETQPVMMRMQSDLARLCVDALEGSLAGQSIEFDDQVALTVVMACGGYPVAYDSGDEIMGLETCVDAAGVGSAGKVFHAGTEIRHGRIVTSGGRVLGVTALGESVTEAQKKAYAIIDKVSYRNAHFRTDIGYRAVARESGKP